MYISNKISAKSVYDFLCYETEKCETDIHSIVMYENNELVLKLQFEPYNTSQNRQVYSISKTVSAIAVLMHHSFTVNPLDRHSRTISSHSRISKSVLIFDILSILINSIDFVSKRQMIHTFTPSNQNVTIGSGGDANETFTGRVERNH